MTSRERAHPPVGESAAAPADIHEAAALEHLRGRIVDAGGWLPFDEFMHAVLYAPGLGYYSAGSLKFGVAGDFVTAPELSPLFGHCLAQQCAQVLTCTGGEILELGAGTGSLACDLLSALQARRSLPTQYCILEVSAELRARQQQSLSRLPAPLAQRVRWLERLPQAPWRGVILANEVLDALPCERFRVAGGHRIEELGVALGADGRPGWQPRAAREPLLAQIARVEERLAAPLPAGYESELCPRVDALIASLAADLQQGLALICDYGLCRAQYYHAERMRGTLRCHYRHRAHDNPFVHPGLQDITAWVDFTRVAEAAEAAQLTVLGFATQAAFLLGTGIEAQLAGIADPLLHARRVIEARALLMPGEMGEAFKVMALGRNLPREVGEHLLGFVHQDLRYQL